MTVTIRLPAPLCDYADGVKRLTFEAVGATTLAALLADLDTRFPAIGRRVIDEQGAIRRHVHVYIGDERARSTTDAVHDGDEVTIMPAVSGG